MARRGRHLSLTFLVLLLVEVDLGRHCVRSATCVSGVWVWGAWGVVGQLINHRRGRGWLTLCCSAAVSLSETAASQSEPLPSRGCVRMGS